MRSSPGADPLRLGRELDCETRSQGAVVLTGQRRDDRHEVRIYGYDVWLPPSLFCAWLALVTARAAGKPCVRLARAAVNRLRCEIAAPLDMATAKELVVQAGNSEYFLAVPAGEIAFAPLFRTILARNRATKPPKSARERARLRVMRRLKTAILRTVAELPKASTQVD